jgi:hypothetical protein
MFVRLHLLASLAEPADKHQDKRIAYVEKPEKLQR